MPSDLPVRFGRSARDPNVVIGTDERVRRLGEEDRLLRYGLAGLGGMVAVVEADAQDLVGRAIGADPLPRKSDHVPGGRPFDDGRADALQLATAEELLAEVIDEVGDVHVSLVVNPGDRLLSARHQCA